MHSLVKQIISNLSDDLLSSRYRKLKTKNSAATFGHCYVASECAYYLLGGKNKGWKPQFIKHEDSNHWFLLNNDGTILDITANQFKTTPDYSKAKGIGFLTNKPSKRCLELLKRIENR